MCVGLYGRWFYLSFNVIDCRRRRRVLFAVVSFGGASSAVSFRVDACYGFARFRLGHRFSHCMTTNVRRIAAMIFVTVGFVVSVGKSFDASQRFRYKREEDKAVEEVGEVSPKGLQVCEVINIHC